MVPALARFMASTIIIISIIMSFTLKCVVLPVASSLMNDWPVDCMMYTSAPRTVRVILV
jgi:hypothetical protein